MAKISSTFKKYLCLFIIFLTSLTYSQIQIGDDIRGTEFDLLGLSVSLSSDGSIFAIGSPEEGNNGTVQVFENVSNDWVQIGSDIEGIDFDERFGESVSLSADGNIVAVGAPYNDDNGIDAGQVRVFENIGGTWIQVGANIIGEDEFDRFGWSVSISSDGSKLAIGAPKNEGNGFESGHIRIFENLGGVWTQIGMDIDGEAINDEFGSSISLSSDGSIVASGAPDNDEGGTNAGHARVYQNVGGSWVQLGADIDGDESMGETGSSVSLSGNGQIVAVGAPNNNSFGDVRVYQFVNDSWSQLGEDIDGNSNNDKFGRSVSLSSDGRILAVGDFRFDQNGNDSGLVRLFRNVNDNWSQIGVDIYGESTTSVFGRSTAISSNGAVVAAGGPGNSTSGNSAGYAQAYSFEALSLSDYIDKRLTIFPIPARKKVNIQLSDDITLLSTTLYNSLGQVIKTYHKSDIDISLLPTGIYLAEIVTDRGNLTKKIIKI